MLLELAQESEEAMRQLQFCCWENSRYSAVTLDEGPPANKQSLLIRDARRASALAALRLYVALQPTPVPSRAPEAFAAQSRGRRRFRLRCATSDAVCPGLRRRSAETKRGDEVLRLGLRPRRWRNRLGGGGAGARQRGEVGPLGGDGASHAERLVPDAALPVPDAR
eukprot:1178119-Prorocentrum_minimum.AAC.4